MKIVVQILGDIVRVQFVAEEPGVSLDLSEEFPPGPTADALRQIGDGEHIVADDFFERLQESEE